MWDLIKTSPSFPCSAHNSVVPCGTKYSICTIYLAMRFCLNFWFDALMTVQYWYLKDCLAFTFQEKSVPASIFSRMTHPHNFGKSSFDLPCTLSFAFLLELLYTVLQMLSKWGLVHVQHDFGSTFNQRKPPRNGINLDHFYLLILHKALEHLLYCGRDKHGPISLHLFWLNEWINIYIPPTQDDQSV